MTSGSVLLTKNGRPKFAFVPLILCTKDISISQRTVDVTLDQEGTARKLLHVYKDRGKIGFAC